MNTCHAILKGTGPPYKGEEGAAARPKRGEVKNDPAHRRCAGPTYLRATRRGPPVVLTGRHRRHPVALAASSLFDSRPPLPFLPRKKHFLFSKHHDAERKNSIAASAGQTRRRARRGPSVLRSGHAADLPPPVRA
jgi:hypothetical protein